MQYVVLKKKTDSADLFAEENAEDGEVKTLTYELYQKLLAQLSKRSKDAVLPIQIAYFTGLRLGEVAGLTWQDINLDEQYLTVRRSVRYNSARHKTEIGPTKRKKVRTVDFCDTLAEILRAAKRNSTKTAFSMGSYIIGTTTKKSERKTGYFMNTTTWTEHRKFPMTTRKSLLFV